jgi:hypothetical protein
VEEKAAINTEYAIFLSAKQAYKPYLLFFTLSPAALLNKIVHHHR